MKKKEKDKLFDNLPTCAAEFIKLVIKNMRYRNKIRADVMAELTAHFEDGLKDCKTDQEKEQKAKEMVADFGDVKLLAVLLRRAKKRCRPSWQKLLVRSFQIIGIIALYVAIRITYLTIGTANVNVNYIDWLNNLVKVNRPEQENAKLYYDRAAELCLKFPSEIENKLLVCTSKGCGANNRWLTDFNDFEMEHLVKWLNDNQKSFEALRQGSQKAYYWYIYENPKSGPKPVNFMSLKALKPLSKYRGVARGMEWQIIYDAYRGKLKDALNNCLALQRFGMHMQGQGLLIEQMLGIAIEALAHQKIFMLLEKQDMPVGVLRDFYNKLENNLSDEKPVMDMEAEKVYWYDLIQRGFTDDGKGNGKILKNGLPLGIKDTRSSITRFFFWGYPDRREVTATVDEYFEKTAYLLNQTPYELHTGRKSYLWDRIGSECLMLKLLGPANQKIITLGWRLKTGRSGLLTAIAVILYQKEKGNYPTNLDELISSGYLKNLPMDPYSDKPLIYRKSGGSFILYSVGPNFKDDGGQIFRDGTGRAKTWENEGDTVFWPVPKPQTRRELETKRSK